MFTATMFVVDSQATFVYPDSKTGERKTRSGIVKEVGKNHIKLEMVDPNTQALVYKTFNYNKMQKLG